MDPDEKFVAVMTVMGLDEVSAELLGVMHKLQGMSVDQRQEMVQGMLPLP
jgi:hypothetical protein